MATPTAKARTNVLHDYANYTYNLQLWSIGKDDFNKIAQGSIGPDSAGSIIKNGKLLISNGGFNDVDKNSRSSAFGNDMAIDNLEIETVVGNKGPQARGTDAVKFKFEIIEPYSVTLLDRLYELAKSQALGADFKQLIYVLKIQFFGYDDLGNPKVIDATKYFPFTLTSIHFSVTHKGALYSCEAIPVQNLALTILDNQIPMHLELVGEKVKDLFNAKEIEPTKASGNARSDTTPQPSNQNNTVVTKGLAQALADNEKLKVDNGSQKIANEYLFEFTKDLANASILNTKTPNDLAKTYPSSKGAEGQKNLQAGQQGTLQQDTQYGTLKIQAGTKITDLIGRVLTQTDFMQNQVQKNAPKDKPVIMWKIIPKVEILGYDDLTATTARRTTYTVVSYEHYGEDHPNMGQAPMSNATVVKNYEYIYTGNNRDVIKAAIDFKASFYEPRNAVKSTYVGENPNDVQIEDNNKDLRIIKPGILLTNGLANQQNSGDSTSTEQRTVVGEMMSKMFDSVGDMVTLDIEIVGDPDWLQQDNILYSTNVDSSTKTLTDGTINFQNSTTAFLFKFKTPYATDYDPVTGIFGLGNATTSVFSGYYLVTRVVSSFRKGRFTQKLDNYRIRIQNSSETENQ
jgi:hypothetical protein